jgi:chemotaxis response regulator CheB
MTAFRKPQPAQPPGPIRVLIADDDPIVRELLTRVFRRKPNFALVGEAADGAEAVKLTAMLKPDVLWCNTC